MVLSSKKATENEQEQAISVAGVYNLWDILVNCYDTLELLNLYRNFVHDLDLKIMVEDNISDTSKRISEVEKMMKKYKIRTPDRPPKDICGLTNTEILTDQQIAKSLLLIAQENIEMKIRAVIHSKMNDTPRKFFIKLVEEDISNIDSITKYVKLKGWIEQAPLVLTLPENSKENIDVGEAFHLYNHMFFRYLNLEQTKLYIKLAHDGDFKILLNRGYDLLSKQVEEIEKEIKRFGLTFSKRPPAEPGSIDNIEFIDDDFILNILLHGLESAAFVHAQALKMSSTNDRIRKLFIKLLWEELKAIDGLIKYGKIKGWLITAPPYRL